MLHLFLVEIDANNIQTLLRPCRRILLIVLASCRPCCVSSDRWLRLVGCDVHCLKFPFILPIYKARWLVASFSCLLGVWCWMVGGDCWLLSCLLQCIATPRNPTFAHTDIYLTHIKTGFDTAEYLSEDLSHEPTSLNRKAFLEQWGIDDTISARGGVQVECIAQNQGIIRYVLHSSCIVRSHSMCVSLTAAAQCINLGVWLRMHASHDCRCRRCMLSDVAFRPSLLLLRFPSYSGGGA